MFRVAHDKSFYTMKTKKEIESRLKDISEVLENCQKLREETKSEELDIQIVSLSNMIIAYRWVLNK